MDFNSFPVRTPRFNYPCHRYNYCIRQEQGASCVTYNVCGATPGSTAVNTAFSLNQRNPLDLLTAVQDVSCTQDYIGIVGALIELVSAAKILQLLFLLS